jgi:16S rRNA C967 or C1407 C5-methylase (RsmB/RsmF family)
MQSKGSDQQGNEKDAKWVDYRKTNVTWENIHEKRQGVSPSPAFEEYYKRQAVCPEAEWAEFMDILQTPLPISFRINGTGKFSEALRRRFENDFFSRLSSLSVDGAPLLSLPCHRQPR